MTDEEKKQLVDAVITQLKNDGTDVSNANIVSNANGIGYVVAYGKDGQIVRAVPTAISSEKVGATGYMNAYTEAGVYTINTIGGEDLPIDNQGAISARLTVLVTESGGNKVITQVLNLNNNAGGEGNVYIRSCQNGVWKAWGKLQTNIEVEQLVAEEKTRAEQAEKTIDDKLNEEIERSVGADQDLLSGIDNEARRATEAEKAIVENTDKKIATEIDKIKDGDTIVGQAREIHSRNGKTVTDSFLARTTAGSGTIGDGVASLKSVGGNIVKNLVDGTFENGWETFGSTVTINDGIVVCTTSMSYGRYRFPINRISGHKYYVSTLVNGFGDLIQAVISGAYIADANTEKNGWIQISYVTNDSVPDSFFYISCATSGHTFYATKPLLVDLTERFGAGNEPDKATCDKLFGTMDALPQGLSIAKPTEFKSIGFNQFNPNNVLEGKAIVDNAIGNGDKKIAVIPCLPCKVGTGENNGYCIHGDFGEDINVYLTPLNPMEVDGELYMHELTKDATTDTYVPLIKGYMLVEVPTTANLCAHFLWSEDKCKRDTYEPYFESKVELPTIPEMSEYGLAGIQSSGTLLCDEIDFERGIYVKRIGVIDLGNYTWFYDAANKRFSSNIELLPIVSVQKAGTGITDNYTLVTGESFDKGIDKSLRFDNGVRRLYIRDTSYTNSNIFKNALQGVMFYYELAEPEEYPLPKVDNNYISSDYGVEQFDSVVPCNANNLYYMRSLAGETRNFLDRLMAGLGTSDATVVADRILAVVNPAIEPANVEPETPIEE